MTPMYHSWKPDGSSSVVVWPAEPSETGTELEAGGGAGLLACGVVPGCVLAARVLSVLGFRLVASVGVGVGVTGGALV